MAQRAFDSKALRLIGDGAHPPQGVTEANLIGQLMPLSLSRTLQVYSAAGELYVKEQRFPNLGPEQATWFAVAPEANRPASCATTKGADGFEG